MWAFFGRILPPCVAPSWAAGRGLILQVCPSSLHRNQSVGRSHFQLQNWRRKLSAEIPVCDKRGILVTENHEETQNCHYHLRLASISTWILSSFSRLKRNGRRKDGITTFAREMDLRTKKETYTRSTLEDECLLTAHRCHSRNKQTNKQTFTHTLFRNGC